MNDISNLNQDLLELKNLYKSNTYPDLQSRIQLLNKIKTLLVSNEGKFTEAVKILAIGKSLIL